MRDVEHPGIAAHGVVLVDLRAVMNRHVEAAEVDHPGARGTVNGVEGGGLQHVALAAIKRATRSSASPRLSLVPERLRLDDRAVIQIDVPLRWAARLRCRPL